MCPYCGSKEIKVLNVCENCGAGTKQCVACRRVWKIGDEAKIIDSRRIEGMICPYCNSMQVVNNGGIRKLCRSCGKHWTFIVPAETTLQGEGGKVIDI